MKSNHSHPFLYFGLILLLMVASPLVAEEHEGEHAGEELENANTLRMELKQYLGAGGEGQELATFIKTRMPKEVHIFINGMIQRDPFHAEELVVQFSEIYEHYAFLQKEAPDEAGLFLQVQQHEALSLVLAESFDPESPSAGEISKKIQAELEKAFDLKLQMETMELQQLEEDVEELSQLLERRRTAREAIIKRRLDELTGVDGHLEW